MCTVQACQCVARPECVLCKVVNVYCAGLCV